MKRFNQMNSTIPIAFLLLIATTVLGDNAEWPAWRGPTGQGHADAHDLPTQWGDGKNVTWSTPIPGRGWSTPVIDSTHIWLTAGIETPDSPENINRRLKADTGGQPLTLLASVSLRAIAIDRRTGKLLHNIEVLDKANPQWVHKDNTYASPSPILENDRLYCHFGAYGTICLNTKTSEVLWRNTSLHIMHENGPGGSPILWNDRLFIHCDGSDQQYIAALDKATGELLWKTDRSGSMHSNPQLKKSYGTPIIQIVDGKPQLLSPAANWLYAYDPDTGSEIWKLSYGALGFSIVPKPVLRDDLIFMSTSFMRAAMIAIRNDGSKPPAIEWQFKRGAPSIPSPIVVGSELYFVSDSGGMLTCLDATSGEEHYRERLGGNYSASPILADGNLYIPSREGKITVIEPGKEFKVVAENQLDGSIGASPVAVGSELYIRTEKALHRIETL
jgi:outer membrane protein assembly factor BamB